MLFDIISIIFCDARASLTLSAYKLPGDLDKIQILIGRSGGFCIFNELHDDAKASGLRTRLGELVVLGYLLFSLIMTLLLGGIYLSLGECNDSDL